MKTLIETNPSRDGIEETVVSRYFPPEPNTDKGGAPSLQWSWACRKLDALPLAALEDSRSAPPMPGDVAVVRVEKAGFHKYLTTAANRRLRLYPGAQFVGVFGNRYASDAYEAEVDGLDRLSLLTAAGMIGTVKSKHESMADPTGISLVGFVSGPNGMRLNLKDRLFRPAPGRLLPRNLIYMVGTGMNSGKTTSAARLIRGLCDMNLSVAACKLTGSVSNRDQDELAAAASHDVTDFSDFGFPSTYLCPKEELLGLFQVMIAEVTAGDPDVVLMELADGLLQRETAMLLADPEIRRAGRGVVLSAESSLSALCGTERLRKLGYQVVAVSGKFTSSPLAMREYRQQGDPTIPVVSSAGTGAELAARVRSFLSSE